MWTLCIMHYGATVAQRVWWTVTVVTAINSERYQLAQLSWKKVSHTPLTERRRVSISLSWALSCRWWNINVCDLWPAWRQTYGYLPSRKARAFCWDGNHRSGQLMDLPIGWYQIILLSFWGTCVLTTCPGLHSTVERPGFEPATCWSQVQRPDHSATKTGC